MRETKANIVKNTTKVLKDLMNTANTKTNKVEAKKKVELVITPVGRMNYVWLSKPDTGREYSDEKYKFDLIFNKDKWKEEGKALRVAVIQEARKFFNNPSIKSLSEFRHPFKDGDEKESKDGAYKNTIYITVKSKFQPKVLGPDKKELAAPDVEKIKSGDYARAVVAVIPYPHKGGGISLALNVVQFARVGEPIGGGAAAASINLLDELDVDLDNVDLDTPEDEEADLPDESDEASDLI